MHFGELRKPLDYARCAARLGATAAQKRRILWAQTKNVRVRAGLASHDGHTFVLDTRGGPLYLRDNFGDVTNLVDLFLHEVYFVPALDEPGAVVDVGANIGLAAAFFVRSYPRRKIVCVEPLEANAALIPRNCPAAVVERVAAGARAGEVSLEVDSDDVMGSRLPRDRPTRAGSFPVLPLDEILARHDEPVALLKIDVEGMEDEVLAGARETLRRTAHVVMETHGPTLETAARRRLEEAGFGVEADARHHLLRARRSKAR